jgi:hypothetical protein
MTRYKYPPVAKALSLIIGFLIGGLMFGLIGGEATGSHPRTPSVQEHETANLLCAVLANRPGGRARSISCVPKGDYAVSGDVTGYTDTNGVWIPIPSCGTLPYIPGGQPCLPPPVTPPGCWTIAPFGVVCDR